MRVKATKKGFDGATVREPGDIFNMPDDAKGSWFEPVDGDKPEVKAEAKAKGKKDDGANGLV